jgi:PLP dependent protein
VIDCLLQIHIAKEETKFGLDEEELTQLLNSSIAQLLNVRVVGLMGMASFSEDMELVRSEFKYLKNIFNKANAQCSMLNAQLPANGQRSSDNDLLSTVNCPLSTLSMGMSGDYKIAIEEGSTMVRIGSLIFGERNYTG